MDKWDKISPCSCRGASEGESGSSFHKRKGLVVPAGCDPAWGGMLING